jgi:hypothetical protein
LDERNEEFKMKYALLINEGPEDMALRKDANEHSRNMAAYGAYYQAMMEAGVFVSGQGLEHPETATTLRIREGKRSIQDGPFADTREQFGGFYIIEVADLDAALDWAARCPGVGNGSVEIRPLLCSD